MKRLGATPRRSIPVQPVGAGHRPLGPGRRGGDRGGLPGQRQPRVQPEPRALRLPPLGPGRVPNFRPCPRHRDRPPGERRIPGAGGLLVDRRRGGRGRPRARSPTPTPWSGTDSHTTMINGLGVLGWGVGGIEAEAAMLGQPVSMLVRRSSASSSSAPCARGRRRPTWSSPSPRCSAARGWSASSSSSSAPGSRPADGRPLHDRQHGPRVWRDLRIFPIDAETLATSSSPAARALIRLVEATQGAGLFHEAGRPRRTSDTLSSTWRPSSPASRPEAAQDRVPL
jgi:hypothetical protein